jgi:hypothetical protein
MRNALVRRTTVGLAIGISIGVALPTLAAGTGAAAAETHLVRTAGRSATASAACQRPRHGFVPLKAKIPALGRSVKVIQVPREADNRIGAGPLTESGKWLMAMDPRTKPASRHGSVILSGHSWPDGSALGNAMLANLQVGDRIVMIGADGKHACYAVSKRQSYPVAKVPTRRAFRTNGPERLVIVACSGKRVGPGDWLRRTLWYATPVLPTPPAPAPAPTPPPTTTSGGLLGGLLGII